MWTVELRGTGEAFELVDVERPRPEPQAGEVLVKINAASLNYRDLALFRGEYGNPPRFPLVPLSDGAGEVVSVGENATRFRAGDRVIFAMRPLWTEGWLAVRQDCIEVLTMSTRVLACDMSALTREQRTRHVETTKKLLQLATRRDLDEGFVFTIEREQFSAPELAEWVADEARCCPAVDFSLKLPFDGPFTLRLSGGEDVKRFIAAELGISVA